MRMEQRGREDKTSLAHRKFGDGVAPGASFGRASEEGRGTPKAVEGGRVGKRWELWAEQRAVVGGQGGQAKDLGDPTESTHPQNPPERRDKKALGERSREQSTSTGTWAWQWPQRLRRAKWGRGR